MNVNELRANIRELDSSAKISGLRKAELSELYVAMRDQRLADLSAHYAPKAAWRIRCATGFNVSVHKLDKTWTVELEGQTLWSNVRLDALVAEIERRPEAASKWLLAATL